MFIVLHDFVGQLLADIVGSLFSSALTKRSPKADRALSGCVWTILLLPLLGLEPLFLLAGIVGSWVILVTVLPCWTLLCWVALRYWFRAVGG